MLETVYIWYLKTKRFTSLLLTATTSTDLGLIRLVNNSHSQRPIKRTSSCDLYIVVLTLSILRLSLLCSSLLSAILFSSFRLHWSICPSIHWITFPPFSTWLSETSITNIARNSFYRSTFKV